MAIRDSLQGARECLPWGAAPPAAFLGVKGNVSQHCTCANSGQSAAYLGSNQASTRHTRCRAMHGVLSPPWLGVTFNKLLCGRNKALLCSVAGSEGVATTTAAARCLAPWKCTRALKWRQACSLVHVHVGRLPASTISTVSNPTIVFCLICSCSSHTAFV